MEEQKDKKKRISKVASEINIPAEQIVEFLKKKGFDVKGLNSIVTQEMSDAISNQFKKDIEKVIKHQRKIEEFNKKFVKEVPAAKEEKSKVETPSKPTVSPKATITEQPVIPIESAIEKEVLIPVQPLVESEVKVEETKEVEVQPEEKKEAPIPQEIPQVQEPVIEEAAIEVVAKPEVEAVEVPLESIETKETVQIIPDIIELPKESDIQQEKIETKSVTIEIEPSENKEIVIESKIEENTVSTVETTASETSSPIVKFITETQEELSRNKGLTVLGKMDLNPAKRRHTETQKETKESRESKEAKETKEAKEHKEVSAETKVQEAKKEEQVKTKKKKKPKTKAKKKETAAPEEQPVVKKKPKVKKFEINQKEVQDTIRKTLLSIDEASGGNRAVFRKKKRKERQEEEEKKEEIRLLDSKKIRVTEYIAVNELANLMDVNVSEVIAKCISLGLMVSINQRLDVETITLVADEFGFEIELQKEYSAVVLEDKPDSPESLVPRSPVVTIMGHVDHGKTSLLDYIRQTNVVAGESGGITQHIGAYKVGVGNGKYITFLDTPGHEAFTAMRARGAQVTDIVILVVAADDAVMPQTVEAISHAQAANVPIIVAINKIDKPGANIDKIKQQLADRKVLVEDWGGKHQCVEVSAKKGTNVANLLEIVLLEADVLELKANPDRLARGIVIESELDKGRGITATVLVQKGTLRVGDSFVAGTFHGRVRAMFDERNKKITEAGPCTPVLVLGFEGAPQAGDAFIVLESEREAKEIAVKRQQLKREQDQKQVHHITLDEISKQISIGGVKELPVIVKGDVDGSVEALADSLMKLSKEEVIVRVIHRGVGAISEGDVLLAAASNAIIIGFHVRPNINARKLAEAQKVDIRLYNIIYDAINEVKSALEGLLSPIISEEITATVEIRDVFRISKIGTVAGCFVVEGKILRNNKIRIIRNGIVIWDGTLLALKRFKDDVREVDAGYECGLSVNNFNDIKIGDIVEAYKVIETKKKFD